VVDIANKQPSPAQRSLFAAALAAHWDVDPRRHLKQTERKAEPPIFKVPMDNRTNSDTIVKGFRQFIVMGALPQYAFPGSHSLELYATLGQDNYFVNDISVLSRLFPAECENCLTNQQSRITVRGAMYIPHGLVVEILQSAGANDKTTSEASVIQAISERLHMRIVTPAGDLLAEAKHRLMTGPGTEARVQLPNEKRPTVRIYSAMVDESEESATVDEVDAMGAHPVKAWQYTDIRDHGLLHQEEWATLS
jgi:hypothetical protein